MDVGDLLAKAGDNLSVRRAFGAAYEKDGVRLSVLPRSEHQGDVSVVLVQSAR